MAKTPNGVTTQNSIAMSDEQAQLLVKVVNSTAEESIPVSGPLLDYIKTIFSAEEITIPSEVSAEDFRNLAASGNLSAIIPAGFLMLHRDLLGLSDGTSITGTALNTNTTGSLLASGLLAAAGLLGAGLISDSLSDLMNDLLDEVDVTDLANDDDIKDAVKKGLKGYITVFFLSQSAYLIENVITHLITDIAAFQGVLGIGTGVSGTFNKIAEGALIVERAAEVVQEVLSLFGGEKTIEQQQAELALKVADNVLTAMTSDTSSLSDLTEDEGIREAVKSGIAAYVKTFFLTQSAQLVMNPIEDIVSYIGAAVVTGGVSFVIDFAAGIVKDLASLITGEPTIEDKMAQLALDTLSKVLDDTTIENIKESLEIQEAIQEGLSYYILGFFKAQAMELSAALAPDTAAGGVSAFFQSFAELPVLLLGGVEKVFKKIAGWFSTDESLEDKIANTAMTLISNSLDTIDVSNLDTAGVVRYKEAALEGLESLVTGYFQAIGQGFTEGDLYDLGYDRKLLTTISTKAVDQIGTVLDAVGDVFTSGLDYSSLAQEGISSFIKSYFDRLAETITVEGAIDTPMFNIEATTIINRDNEDVSAIRQNTAYLDRQLAAILGLLKEIKDNPVNIAVSVPQQNTALNVNIPD